MTDPYGTGDQLRPNARRFARRAPLEDEDEYGINSDRGDYGSKVLDPSASIPSPFVGKQSDYDRTALSREFDREVTGTGVPKNRTMPMGVPGMTPEQEGRARQSVGGLGGLPPDWNVGFKNLAGREAAAREKYGDSQEAFAIEQTPDDDDDSPYATQLPVFPEDEDAGLAGSDEAVTAPAAPRGNNPDATETFTWGERGGINPEYFSGFDLQRDQNPGRSAKDRTAELFAASNVNPAEFAGPDGKERVEQYFRSQIMPGLIESGYQVLDVKGDKAYIKSWDGEGWVDYMTNVTSGDPSQIKFAWQTGEDQPAGADTGGMGGGDIMGGIEGGATDSESDLLAQILANLNSLQEGGDPYLRNALGEEFEQAVKPYRGTARDKGSRLEGTV